MIDYSKCPEVQIWNGDMEIIERISPESYSYLRFIRNLRSNDTFEFHINQNHPKAAALLDENSLCLVFFDGNTIRSGIIEDVKCSMNNKGPGEEEIVVTGRSGGIFSSRITLMGTQTGTGYDTQTGNAETVMKHYVDVNCVNAVNGTNVTDTKRKIPSLVIADNQNRGDEVTYSARYKVLSDVLNSLAYSGNIGWEITFDWNARKFIFDVIKGTDRSETVSSSPVIFKPKLNNVISIDYSYSRLGTSNYAYVGGQGEAAERTIVNVKIDDTEPSGFNRREVFVDQRNTDDSSELTTSGQSELEENSGEITLSAELNISCLYPQYQVDYNLGDIVTVDYDGVISLDVPIISVTDEVVGGNRGGIRTITLEFGTEPSDIRRMVKKSNMKKGDELI